jgi:hypothetical protein
MSPWLICWSTAWFSNTEEKELSLFNDSLPKQAKFAKVNMVAANWTVNDPVEWFGKLMVLCNLYLLII